ncbi:hypothetical protein [Nocardioides jensenii]|uniref:hypothetical protein n=1 Tax=Nocardioides jensenii TaxID=1843 RepID=UPI000836773D|nr:hypothetical protein [Nocardioides jensenii]
MDTHPVDASHPLLTFGPVELVRVQVGYRADPEDAAQEQFLLDLTVPKSGSADGQGAFDEHRALRALEPALLAGTDAPRHHSLHQHRSHTSWGASPGVLELGLLVTTGTEPRAAGSQARLDGVTRAFRDLMELTGRSEQMPTTRDAAFVRARRAAATAYAVDSERLSLGAEEHHAAENVWAFTFRAPAGDAFEVRVGFVDGYAGSVWVRHERQHEVSDSIGSE